MMGTMKAIWKLSREVHIMAIEDNLFLFKFHEQRDKVRVMEGAPWSFDKQMLLFQEFISDLRPEEYVFQTAILWLRIYDLPLGMRNKAIGEMIGRRIGKLIATDESLDGRGWANFLRIRVEMDIKSCEIIKHRRKGMEKEESDGLNQYGDWLRASPLKKGITFDKENSSTAKMRAFWTQMKATPSQNGGIHGGSSTKGNTWARKLQWDVNNTLIPTPEKQNKRVNLTEKKEVDTLTGKRGNLAELHQKIVNLKVGEESCGIKHQNGNSKNNQRDKQDQGITQTHAEKVKDESMSVVSTRKVIARISESLDMGVAYMAQTRKTHVAQEKENEPEDSPRCNKPAKKLGDDTSIQPCKDPEK
ncbi:hypothetical protein PTKIN_Ptkin02bG0073300 [Pterospermum kingtungense]